MNYFDTTHAIKVHDDIILKSGGTLGVINIGLVDSCLEHIQNDLYYPEIENKLTHLFYCINKSHSFADGNKRASIALSAYFLEINGLDFRVNRFITSMENIAVYVADNIVDKELLGEIIYSLIYEDDYSQELKMKIITSLSS